MAAEGVQDLAQLAGRTLMAVAVTDPSGAAGHRFGLLLGQGNDGKAKLAEQRLAQTRQQLARAAYGRAEGVWVALEAQWVTRLADLLEECPGVEAELRALVEETRAALPTGVKTGAHDVARRAGNVPISAGHYVAM